METEPDIEKIRALAREQSIIPGDNDYSTAKIIIECGKKRYIVGMIDMDALRDLLST